MGYSVLRREVFDPAEEAALELVREKISRHAWADMWTLAPGWRVQRLRVP